MSQSPAARRRELAAAVRRIAQIDPAFTAPIKRLAPCTFGLQRRTQTNYQSLVRAVIAQQVSVAAAKTIYRRLEERCAGRITPPRVGALSSRDLQSIGLTTAKVRTIHELTAGVRSGAVPLKRFTYMSDEAIIAALTPLFGIGRWTAEMFLIFQLGRLDVWPVDDLAVRRGWDVIHQNAVPITAKELRSLGAPFVGMRSLVAWYCWRAS